MFARFIELITNIVNGIRDNIIPMFDFLLYEFSFNNPFTVAIGDTVTFTVFEMLFGGGLIALLTYKIIISLTPVA